MILIVIALTLMGNPLVGPGMVELKAINPIGIIFVLAILLVSVFLRLKRKKELKK
jgi:hypothetical protein